VFYKWSDCKARVAGLADASFQGFTTLEEAEYAFTSGPGVVGKLVFS
jgi:viroplasmin and RNaseH domain-containing protein